MADRSMLAAIMLCAGIALYALRGVPTPAVMGPVEAGVFALLVAAVFLGGGVSFSALRGFSRFWMAPGAAFSLYCLSVPVMGGVWRGHDAGSFARDLVAFGFLMLPFLLAGCAGRWRIVLAAVLLLGAAFALRALGVRGEGVFGEAGRLDYLENMPCVLMAAIFFLGSAIRQFCEGRGAVLLFRAGVFGVIGIVCALPLAMTLQRASIAGLGLCLIALWAVQIWRYPRKAVVLGVVAGAGIFMVPGMQEIFAELADKSRNVGANMRFEELEAVWGLVSENAFSLLFGMGWGAHYSSPAVAGISVNYTHSLLSFLLLKGGIAGLALGLAYLAGILRELLRVAFIPALALGTPILIDTFLYASYKSFDFGLLLALAAWPVAGVKKVENRAQEIASKQGMLYSEI